MSLLKRPDGKFSPGLDIGQMSSCVEPTAVTLIQMTAHSGWSTTRQIARGNRISQSESASYDQKDGSTVLCYQVHIVGVRSTGAGLVLPNVTRATSPPASVVTAAIGNTMP